MTNNFKQKLLLGTALVAVAAFAAPAFATAPEEIVATGNQTPTANDEFVNDVDDSDTLELDLNNVDVTIGNDDGTAQTAAIDINASDASFFVTDNENGGDGGGVLTIEADTDAAGVAAIDVANGKTLNLYVGVDDDGTTLADDPVTVVIAGDVEENTSGTVNIIIGGNVDGATQTLRLDTGAVAQVVDADIKSLTNGEGTLDIDTTGAVTINGNIGGATAGTDDLAAVLLADGANVTSNGHIFATAITLGSANTTAATLTLTGTNVTVSSAINSDGNSDNGILNVDGSVTFTGVVGAGGNELDSITIGSGATATFDAAVDVTGAGAGTVTFDNATGTIVLGAGGANASAFDGNILGAGTLVFNGRTGSTTGSDVDGNVGANTTGNTLAKVEIRSDATGAETFNLTGNLYTTLLQFGTTGTTTAVTADGTLLIDGSNNTVNIGSVTTIVDGEGNLNITPAGGASTTVSVGQIGTSTSSNIGDLTINATNATVNATFTGSIWADNILVDGAGAANLIFNATGAQTVNALIDPVGQDDGDIIIGDGNITTSAPVVTFVRDVGVTGNELDSFTVNSDGTAIFSADAYINGDITNDGVIRVAQSQTLFLSDAADQIADGTAEGTYELVIGTTTAGVDDSSTIDLGAAIDWRDFNGTTTNGADTLLKQGTGVILNGQDFLILDGTGNVTFLTAGEAVDDEYALFNFKAYTGDVKVVGGSDISDVVVEATYADADSVTVTTNNAHAAEGLLNVTVAEYAASRAGDDKLADVYDNVTRATNAQVDERLEATQATVDGGNVVAGLSVANISSNIIQMASLDAEGSGISAGNISNGLRAWAQVFGQTGEQDARDGIDGYDIDTFGFAVGLDTQALMDQMVWGLAFSYADSDIDSDNANRTNTEVDTYQITLYGTYNVDEATYISGQLGWAFGDNETHRNDIGGVAAIDANGDFDSNQFLARLEAGRAYEVGAITTLTPKVLVNYNYYDADSYTETGAGGAGLHIDQDTLHVFEVGAGVDADWMFQQADGSYVKPAVSLGFRYDLADDEVETTNEFIGGGAAFKTEGWDPQQFTVDAGASVTYFSTTNWELTADYAYEWKEDYDSHAGFLRAGYKF